MGRQIIIAVNGEFDSGKSKIAREIADRLQITFLNQGLQEKAAMKSGYPLELIKRYDGLPRNTWTSRTCRGYTNSIEVNVADQIFDCMKEEVEEENSFVVVDRCANYILKDAPGLISIFILGKGRQALSYRRLHQVRRKERARISYERCYSKKPWRRLSSYDLVIRSSELGTRKTTDAIMNYIQLRRSES